MLVVLEVFFADYTLQLAVSNTDTIDHWETVFSAVSVSVTKGETAQSKIHQKWRNR